MTAGKFSRVCCLANTAAPDCAASLQRLEEQFTRAGCELVAEPGTVEDGAQLLVVLGGDGFLMECLHRYDFPSQPIFGVNFGTVGFHMNPQACLDDAVNWIPARIAGALITMAALGQAAAALRAISRDANRHRSVNAGWQEAPMAGALGLALAGPRRYGDVVIDDAWMGDGRREATADDIRRALWLYRRAGIALGLLVAGLLAL